MPRPSRKYPNVPSDNELLKMFEEKYSCCRGVFDTIEDYLKSKHFLSLPDFLQVEIKPALRNKQKQLAGSLHYYQKEAASIRYKQERTRSSFIDAWVKS